MADQQTPVSELKDTAASRRVALVTGAAVRIGAAIASHLHGKGLDIVLHYRSSQGPAQALAAELNAKRPDSVITVAANIVDAAECKRLVAESVAWRGRLDVLVNNASSFYPTPIGEATPQHWDDLVGSNLKGPFFLSQAAADPLRAQRGSIVNLTDIWVLKTLSAYPIYSAAKSGLVNLTRTMALDLAPDIRVNAVAPGAILWGSDDPDPEPAKKAETLARIPLGVMGTPEAIASAVSYLALDADYITGQMLAVDGGSSLR